MLLSLSSLLKGQQVDLNSIIQGQVVDSGVVASNELIAFAESVLQSQEDELHQARERLISTLSPQAMVDAAAIVANFSRMVRIADGTGIPLDQAMEEGTSDMRKDLGINALRQNPG
jgi:hypothetical protein